MIFPILPAACTHEMHASLKTDPLWWAAQELIGIQEGIEEIPPQEARNCSMCKSTLYMPVSAAAQAEV